MNKHEKLLIQILGGTSDANIQFDRLCKLLRYLGFEERIKGSTIYLQKVAWKKSLTCNLKEITRNLIRLNKFGM